MSVPIQRNFVLDSPALREMVAGVISRRALRLTFLLALSLTRFGLAQIDTSSVAPHRYLVLYRNATIPGDAEAHVASVGAHVIRRNEHFGIAAVESAVAEDDASTLRRLASQPNVDYVLHDRIVTSHRLRFQAVTPASIGVDVPGQSPSASTPIGRLPTPWPNPHRAPHLPTHTAASTAL